MSDIEVLRAEVETLRERASLLKEKEILMREIGERGAKSWDSLVLLVAEEFEVTVKSMHSRCRPLEQVRARQVAQYLIRKHWPSATYDQIGRYFSGRDRRTIRYSCSVIRNEIGGSRPAYPDLKAKVVRIEKILLSWFANGQATDVPELVPMPTKRRMRRSKRGKDANA